MRRRWKGNCVYCGRAADTKEHCPPRLLLEREYPRNLRTLRACRKCNESYSSDEQYFLAILAQISTNPTLTAKIEQGGSIDRALVNSPGLEQRISRSLSVDVDGRVVLQPEMDRLHRVIQKIAAGLYALKYGKAIAIDRIIPIGAFPCEGGLNPPMPIVAITYTERFRPKRWTHVQKGVFSYIIVRDPVDWTRLYCIMEFHQSLWGVVMFPQPTRSSKQQRNSATREQLSFSEL